MAGVQDRPHIVPKAELHVHLRGAIPKDLLTHLLNECSALPVWREGPREWRPLFEAYDHLRPFLSTCHRPVEDVSQLLRIETFEQFVATYVFVGCYVRTASDFRRQVLGFLEELKSQNVVYAEITASMHRHARNGIPLADIAACLDEGANHGGITVRVARTREAQPVDVWSQCRRVPATSFPEGERSYTCREPMAQSYSWHRVDTWLQLQCC